LFHRIIQIITANQQYYMLLIGGIIAFVITCAFLLVVYKRKRTSIVALREGTSSLLFPSLNGKPRFRKRDRIRFYTTKMLRKVKEFKDDVLPNEEVKSVRSRRRRRQRSSSNLQSFTRFLHGRNKEIKRMSKEVPASLLEADLNEAIGSDPQLPSEVMYMLRSVRVFGQFETPLFFELCKYIVTKSIPTGKILFRPGLMEECIYIVQSGQLNLYLVDKKGNEMLLKKVKAGENIYSVMNILDAIRGVATYRYSILIRADTDSQVLMLPSRAFRRVFEDHPESLVRVVQIVMLRLQQVTFQAFYRFIGLSTELISASSSRRINEELKSLSVYSLAMKESSRAKVNEKLSEASNISSPGRHISSISEAQEDRPTSKNIDIKSSSASHKNEALLNESKSQPAKSSPVTLRRTGSHGRLTNLYGSTSMDDRTTLSLSGPASADFEAVLERVGFESNEPGKFSIGITSEDDECGSQGFEFPKGEVPELVTDDDISYGIPSEEEEKMLSAVRSDLVKLLNLPTPKLLDNILAIDVIPPKTCLVKQGDKDSSLIFLVQGSLDVVQKKENSQEEEHLFTCVPGEFMGSLSLLTGDPSLFSIHSHETSYVVIISKVNFYKLIKEHPKVVLPVAHSLITKISSFVRNIDFALDWTILESGKALFRQNEEPDSIYIVLNGRLRGIQQGGAPFNKKEIVGEYGRGEFIGLVEVLTHRPRAKSVHAIRDTELAQIPEGLLNTIKLHYPQVVSRLIQLLGDRILGTSQKGRLTQAEAKLEMVGKNLSTVAVIPASSSVPLHNFTFELGHAISDIGPALVLTGDVVRQRLGSSVLDSVHEYNLSNWLGHQEDMHRIVVYQADSHMSEWTKRCIRQADAILIVGMGDDEPTVGRLEAQLENMTSVRAQKDLILLYDENNFERPTETIHWLNARGWVSAHHHVRCPRKIFKRKHLSAKYAEDPNYEGPSKTSDFARLARVLTGTSIGLVLGGGGARGIAHIGIIRALTEAGVPIDSVGGTSMGALIGALYAERGDIVGTTQRARDACKKLSSIWRKVLDMTYPYTALFTGKTFNGEIESTFGDMQIEDLLLPYFCITTDISDSRMKVHQTGCLWRYVRASMSLSGYLPPMCDPLDGHLLLDGGYVNNLPADVMRTLGVKSIIAVDVGSQNEVDLTNFGDSLSGWWMLWKKFNPFTSPVRIPDMAGIQSRLAYVSCVQQLEEVKNSGFCHYIRPPIDKFKTMQFGSYDEIHELGYHHGKAVFQSLLQGKLLGGDQSPERTKQKHITVDGTTAPSFTDLAELVSQIKAPGTISRDTVKKISRMFESYSDEDFSDNDEVDYVDRGTVSDQELGMPHDNEFMSGTEELGYESEDTSHLHNRRRIFQRMHSNAV